MGDSKLRLQIITALDNAGLKATKDQVGQLEKQFKNINNGSGMDKLNHELTKMPGKFGKISESLGGVGMKVASVYAIWLAFSKGMKAGHEIFKQFSSGAGYSLESINAGLKNLGNSAWQVVQKFFIGTNDIEAAAKAHEVAMSNMQAQVDAAKRANDKQMEYIKEQREAHEKNIESIKRETQAYLNQASSIAGLKNAGSNANVILMERKKFEEMQAYTESGNDEGAEQIGKAYDVLIAKEKAIGIQEQTNIALNKMARSIEGKAQEANAVMDRTDQAALKVQEIQAQIDKMKQSAGGANKARVPAAMQLALKSAQREYQNSLEAEKTFEAQIAADFNNFKALRLNGASQLEAANRAVDSNLFDYYRMTYANGNAANIDFGSTMNSHPSDTMNGYKYLEEISKNTEGVKDLAEVLKELMTMK